MRLAIGCPMSRNITRPTTKVDSSGMTTTGMTPRTPFGTFQRLIHSASEPGEEAGDQATEEAGADGHRDRAADEAGHQAGPVGDRVGDEPGQHRDQEPEGDRPVWNSSAAQSMPIAASKSLSRCATGMPVTSTTPSAPPASCATMKPRAMRIPPAATNGIM